MEGGVAFDEPLVGANAPAIHLDGIASHGRVNRHLGGVVNGGLANDASKTVANLIRAHIGILVGGARVALKVHHNGAVGRAAVEGRGGLINGELGGKIGVGRAVARAASGRASGRVVEEGVVAHHRSTTRLPKRATARCGLVALVGAALDSGRTSGDVHATACVGRVGDDGVVDEQVTTRRTVQRPALVAGRVVVNEVVVNGGHTRRSIVQVDGRAVGGIVLVNVVAYGNGRRGVGHIDGATVGGRVVVKLVRLDDRIGLVDVNAAAMGIATSHCRITTAQIEAGNGGGNAGGNVNHPPQTERIQHGDLVALAKIIAPAPEEGDAFINVERLANHAEWCARIAGLHANAKTRNVNVVAIGRVGQGGLGATVNGGVVQPRIAPCQLIGSHVEAEVGGAQICFKVGRDGRSGIRFVYGGGCAREAEIAQRGGNQPRRGGGSDGTCAHGRAHHRWGGVVVIIVVARGGCAACVEDGGATGGRVRLEDVAPYGGVACVVQPTAIACGTVGVKSEVEQVGVAGVVEATAITRGFVLGEDGVGGRAPRPRGEISPCPINRLVPTDEGVA